MSRALAIGAVLGLALATGSATAAVAAPSVPHTATHAMTVQSSTVTFDHHGGWDDDGDDYCNGVGNMCA